MKKNLLSLFTLTLVSASTLASIQPGAIWKDNRGVHINAHGGGVIHHKGTYYWFGEHKAENTSNALVGVTCYSSRDLEKWKYRGVALSVVDEQGHDIEKGCIIERPKVVYCKKTKQFVMWFHLELKDQGYRASRYAVAVSDTPTGPYRYIKSGRVNAGIYPQGFNTADTTALAAKFGGEPMEWWTPEWRTWIKKGLFLQRDMEGGQMSRDQTVYVDDDGKAYHIYSSEDNLTIQIAELTDDYLSHTGRYARVAPCGQNEAPAIFKRNGVYWMITSGCTGWEPNEARMFKAQNIFGPWQQLPNPCMGENAKKTFGAQSTYILKVENKPDSFIFMADIWRPNNPIDARYVWLPITFNTDGTPTVIWRSEWKMSQ